MFSARVHYAWVVLAIGTLVVFGAIGMARFGYSVILPPMQSDLGLNNTQAGVLATANMIGYLVLSAIGGALASRYGPRLVIVLGLLVTGVGMILTGVAQGFFSAAVWRALTGLGSGASNVAVMGMIIAWFTIRRRGFASGILVTGASFGLIFVGPLVPRMLSVYGNSGWRMCWIIFGVVTLLFAVIGAFLLKDRPSAVGLAPYGSNGDEPSLHVEKEAIQWGKIYRSAAVWHLGLVYIAFGFSYVIYMTFFIKHLVTTGGYTQKAAGDLFMIMGWCSLFCGVIWGIVSDVVGRKYALMMIYLMHAAAFSLFALWPSPPGFIISAVLYGASAWSIPAIMSAACGDILGPRLAPAAFGFTTIFLGLGQAIGPSVAGALADASGSFSPAFLLAGGVALLGAIGSSRLRPASAVSGISSE